MGLSGLVRAQPIPPSARSVARLIRPTFAVVVLVLMAGIAVTRWVVLSRDQAADESTQFPEKAVAVLRSGDYGGQIFVYYDWGGYAIFKLYPKYRVFVDGRADLYGDDLLHQFQTAVQFRTGWRQVLDRWNLQVVLVPHQSALARGHEIDPEWHMQYRDSQAVLLVRAPKSKGNHTNPSPSG